jgi:hypothetical protein
VPGCGRPCPIPDTGATSLSLAENGQSCSLLLVFSKVFINIAVIHYLTQRRREISGGERFFAQSPFPCNSVFSVVLKSFILSRKDRKAREEISVSESRFALCNTFFHHEGQVRSLSIVPGSGRPCPIPGTGATSMSLAENGQSCSLLVL